MRKRHEETSWPGKLLISRFLCPSRTTSCEATLKAAPAALLVSFCVMAMEALPPVTVAMQSMNSSPKETTEDALTSSHGATATQQRWIEV